MLFSNFKDTTSLRVTMQQAISTTFYRIKKEEEENHRNKKEITTKFDEEPFFQLYRGRITHQN